MAHADGLMHPAHVNAYVFMISANEDRSDQIPSRGTSTSGVCGGVATAILMTILLYLNVNDKWQSSRLSCVYKNKH